MRPCKSAIVVGGGVIGVSTAYALARDGWAVTVLDRCDGVARGASFGNGRQLSYSHTNALAGPGLAAQIPWLLLGSDDAFGMTLCGRQGYYGWLARFLGECLPGAHRRNTLAVLALAEESRSAMERLLAIHPLQFNRAATGKLVLLTDRQEVEAARPMLAAKCEAGLAQKLLSPEQAREIEPALAHSLESIAGALYAPGDEVGDCRVFSEMLMRLLEQSYGARFKGDAHVTSISRKAGNVEVTMSDGDRLATELVVVAIGHAANELLAPLGHRLPIQPMKGYSFTAPLGKAPPRVSVTHNKRRIVFTNCGDRILVAGIAEMGKVDRRIDPETLKSLIASACAALPEAAVYSEADEGWAGLRPMTPNSQPIIGMIEPGIAVNAGHGMLGWTLAMGSAERLGRAVKAAL